MAVRSLTDVYVLMRNNAIQRRELYYDHQGSSSERMQLVKLNSYTDDNFHSTHGNSRPPPGPPAWLSQLDEAHFTLTKLKDKLDELKQLHIKHLTRPTFEDDDDAKSNEKLRCKDEALTHEINRIFNFLYRILQQIRTHLNEGSLKQQKLTENVTQALATNLQNLSIIYRSEQNRYLRQIDNRNETTNTFDIFDNAKSGYNASTLDDMESPLMTSVDYIDECFVQKQKQHNKISMAELIDESQRRQMAEIREKEVNNIMRSIVEMNEIYKDLAHMVVNQGSVLDRIDYNIEMAHVQVQEGYKQLRKAEEYLRNDRKMYCILILATTTILLTFLFIVTKF